MREKKRHLWNNQIDRRRFGMVEHSQEKKKDFFFVTSPEQRKEFWRDREN
jgi:hypothetical protein